MNILGRKSKSDFVREKRLHNKRKSFIKSPCKFNKWQKNCYTFFSIQRVHLGISQLWPLIDLQNQEIIIIVFQVVVKAKELEGKYSFVKNIIFEIVPTIYFNFNEYFVCIIFLLFCYFRRTIYKICVYNKFHKTWLDGL